MQLYSQEMNFHVAPVWTVRALELVIPPKNQHQNIDFIFSFSKWGEEFYCSLFGVFFLILYLWGFICSKVQRSLFCIRFGEKVKCHAGKCRSYNYLFKKPNICLQNCFFRKQLLFPWRTTPCGWGQEFLTIVFWHQMKFNFLLSFSRVLTKEHLLQSSLQH